MAANVPWDTKTTSLDGLTLQASWNSRTNDHAARQELAFLLQSAVTVWDSNQRQGSILTN